jgi:hypothetical protein
VDASAASVDSGDYSEGDPERNKKNSLKNKDNYFKINPWSLQVYWKACKGYQK